MSCPNPYTVEEHFRQPEPGMDDCWRCHEDVNNQTLDEFGECPDCVFEQKLLATNDNEPEFDRLMELGTDHFRQLAIARRRKC